MKRIANLLGLIGLAALVCLVAALTSGCGLPITKAGFQQNLAHGLGPFHGRLDALDRKVVALEESTAANFAVVDANFKTLAGGVEQATRRAEAAKNLGETIVQRLGPIGRNAAVASKEATAGRKATEKAVANSAAAHAALDQKVDRRADEVVSAVAGVDRKVDATKTAAETAASRAGAARDAAIDAKVTADLAKVEAQIAGGKADAAGSKADAAGSRAEAASAKTEADTMVEISKARKELADHATEAERARQAILRLLSSIPPPPAP